MANLPPHVTKESTDPPKGVDTFESLKAVPRKALWLVGNGSLDFKFLVETVGFSLDPTKVKLLAEGSLARPRKSVTRFSTRVAWPPNAMLSTSSYRSAACFSTRIAGCWVNMRTHGGRGLSAMTNLEQGGWLKSWGLGGGRGGEGAQISLLAPPIPHD